MDIRIVNTCNNDCLYCLEGSLRVSKKYIDKNDIFKLIFGSKEKNNITFYGGDPLLHPDILDIIQFSKDIGFINIGILSNSGELDQNILLKMISKGLNTFGIYFNSFDKENHLIVNGNKLAYSLLINNLLLLSKSNINIKVIIHVNKLNINRLRDDIFILNKKFGFKNFDLVNYFPFDKPYLNRNILEYDLSDKSFYIKNIFKLINALKININFLKFSKDFFGEFIGYYDFEKGILNQIGQEDNKRLDSKEKPFCFLEKRCPNCFIKDNCKFYE